MKKITLIIIFYLYLPVSNAQCWSNVSTGGAHTLGIGSDGSLWAWGTASYGQLGTGNQTNLNVPTKIGSDLDWSKISGGNGHSLALKTDGTLWAWGRNATGQLGNSSVTTNLNVPTQVNTDTDWIFISAGDEYSMAIKSNNTLWGWGDNVYSQLGDGTIGLGNMKTTPTQIGTDTDWSFISTGSTHTMAIKTNGTLWGFGRNNQGKLGDGTTFDKKLPVQIGTDTNWQTVEASLGHTVALKTDGSLWAWGDNTDGQLGNGLSGAAAYQYVPTNIEPGNIFLKITRGLKHTLTKRASGTLWSWGGNTSGQIGDNTLISKPSPTAVATTFNNWEQISSRASHCAGMKADGTLYMWGGNLGGQVGDGTNAAKKKPVLIACPTLANNKYDLTTAFSIHPNPTTNYLNISLADNETLTKLIVLDISGKIVLENSENMNLLNVENLSNGIYIIKMFSENKSYQSKFIKN